MSEPQRRWWCVKMNLLGDPPVEDTSGITCGPDQQCTGGRREGAACGWYLLVPEPYGDEPDENAEPCDWGGVMRGRLGAGGDVAPVHSRLRAGQRRRRREVMGVDVVFKARPFTVISSDAYRELRQAFHETFPDDMPEESHRYPDLLWDEYERVPTIEVRSLSRYYGPGYERGQWPNIKTMGSRVRLMGHKPWDLPWRRAERRRGKREWRIEVWPDELDGGFGAECVDLPGCISQGDTEVEARANLDDAIDEWLAAADRD